MCIQTSDNTHVEKKVQIQWKHIFSGLFSYPRKKSRVQSKFSSKHLQTNSIKLFSLII